MKDESRHSWRDAQLHPTRGGFTLIEVLVAIGIIVLLVGILVPLVRTSYVKAGRLRAQADLETIRTALEAYRQDHGDIPRLPQGPQDKNLGAAILGKALLGPYGDGLLPNNSPDNSDPPDYIATVDYVAGDVFKSGGYSYVTLVNAAAGMPAADTSIFGKFDPKDGADGPGFRKRAGGAGPVSPPYLQPGKIGVRGTYLLDHYGNPILYFPANPRKRDLTQILAAPHAPYVDQTDFSTATSAEPQPTFNANDNLEPFARRAGDGKRAAAEVGNDDPALARIRIMLGDFNTNGYIDSVNGAETAVTVPYLLWSAGPDQLLGPLNVNAVLSASQAQVDEYRAAVPKCDDITNFRQ